MKRQDMMTDRAGKRGFDNGQRDLKPATFTRLLVALLSLACLFPCSLLAGDGNKAEVLGTDKQVTPLGTPPPATLSSLPQGGRIAILGDSITYGHLYSRVIEAYLVACAGRKDLSFYTYGWSGATLNTGLGMISDISCFKPTVVTLAYGMNDGGYRPINDYYRTKYDENLRQSVKSLRNLGVQTIIVASPGAVDTKYFVPPHPKEEIPTYLGSTDYGTIYNSTLGTLAELGRSIAAEVRCPFVDLHTPMMETMKKAKAALGDDYDVCGRDGYHPRANGGLVMAYAFLKALGCDGKIGEITIDFDGKSEATEGHVISQSTPGKVEIASSRYPFCFDPDPKLPTSTRSILEVLPFNQDLNRLILRVKHLTTQRAKVIWGGEEKEFDRTKLEEGINLVEEFPKTPFDAEFLRFLSAIAAKQETENGTIQKYVSGCLLNPADCKKLEKDAEVNQSLAQFKTSLMNYHDRTEREIYGALPIIKHAIEVQPIR